MDRWNMSSVCNFLKFIYLITSCSMPNKYIHSKIGSYSKDETPTNEVISKSSSQVQVGNIHECVMYRANLHRAQVGKIGKAATNPES